MYKIEVWDNSRWVLLGGCYPTKEAAEEKIAQYGRCDASKKRRAYRIIW